MASALLRALLRVSICFNDRSLDEGDLVANAELEGATPLMAFAGDGAMTFSY
jgi:hypothetical protein